MNLFPFLFTFIPFREEGDNNKQNKSGIKMDTLLTRARGLEGMEWYQVPHCCSDKDPFKATSVSHFVILKTHAGTGNVRRRGRRNGQERDSLP